MDARPKQNRDEGKQRMATQTGSPRSRPLGPSSARSTAERRALGEARLLAGNVGKFEFRIDGEGR